MESMKLRLQALKKSWRRFKRLMQSIYIVPVPEDARAQECRLRRIRRQIKVGHSVLVGYAPLAHIERAASFAEKYLCRTGGPFETQEQFTKRWDAALAKELGSELP